MWLFTKHGLLSVVADRNNPANLLVRARQAHHITKNITDCLPKYTPNADYHWRVSVDRAEFARLVAKAISEISYPNFKNAADDDLKGIYMKVWGNGLQLQADRYAKVTVLPGLDHSIDNP
jgi:hypothetical protein